MNLLSLKYFVVVAQHGHMTEAARVLNVSQPSLSLTISNLEKELGCKLFDRVGRNIRLSEQGHIFYSHATKSLYILENGARAVRSSRSGQRKIAIAATGARILYEFSREYYKKPHKCNLSIERIGISQIFTSLDNPKYNFVQTTVPLSGGDYNSLLLAEEELYVVVNKAHHLAGRKEIALSEIRDENFISIAKGTGLRENCDIMFQIAGIQPRIISEGDLDMRISLLSVNAGITIAARNALITNVFSDNVEFIPIIDPYYRRKVCLLWNKNRQLTSDEIRFREDLAEYFHANFQCPRETDDSRLAKAYEEEEDLLPEDFLNFSIFR